MRATPQVRRLECRLVPATLEWSAGNGDFNTVANWTVQGSNPPVHAVPTAADDAVILGSAIVTSAAANSVNSLFSIGGSLQVSANLFTVAANAESFIPNLKVDSGATFKVNGTAKVGLAGSDVAGQLRVESGGTLWFRRQTNNLNAGATLTGPGRFLIQDDLSPSGNHSVRINGAVTAPVDLDFTAGILGGQGTLTVPAGVTFDWGSDLGTIMNGAGSTVIDAGGKMVTMGTGSRQIDQRSVLNSGFITYQGAGQLHLTNGAQLKTQIGGAVRIESTSTISGDGALINAGTLTQAATGTTIITSAFQSTGTVSIDAGTLNVRPFFGNGSIAGALKLTGGDLSLGAANFMKCDINAGTSVSGTGSLIVSGGLSLNTDITVSGLQLPDTGFLSGTGKLTLTGTGAWTGGDLNGTGALVVAGGATLNLSGPVDHVLVGGWDLTVTGTINHLAGGNLFTSNDSIIAIGATGTYNLGDAGITFGTATINNAGLFVKTGNATSAVSHVFNNSGTVAINSGTLVLGNSGYAQSAGTTTVASGAILRTGNGTAPMTINGGVIRGGGTLEGDYSGAGTLSPGTSPGTLTLINNNIFGNPSAAQIGGPLAIELNGSTPGSGYDQLIVNGKVALSAGLNLSVGFTPAVNETFAIIANDQTDPVQGTFNGLPQAGLISAGGFTFAVSYVGGDGNDVTLTRITNAPPHVTAVVANLGMAQRSRVTSVSVTFDAIVAFAGNPAAAVVITRQGGNPVGGFTSSVTTNGSTTTVTLSDFTGTETEFGSLLDGRYDVQVLASQVSLNGLALDGNNNGAPGDDYTITGDTSNKLFRLYGDADGDGDVDATDFGAFRAAFGTGSITFDFDNDGDVDAADFGQFRGRFGSSV